MALPCPDYGLPMAANGRQWPALEPGCPRAPPRPTPPGQHQPKPIPPLRRSARRSAGPEKSPRAEHGPPPWPPRPRHLWQLASEEDAAGERDIRVSDRRQKPGAIGLLPLQRPPGRPGRARRSTFYLKFSRPTGELVDQTVVRLPRTLPPVPWSVPWPPPPRMRSA